MRGDEAEVWIGEGTLTRAEREHQRAVYHRYPHLAEPTAPHGRSLDPVPFPRPGRIVRRGKHWDRIGETSRNSYVFGLFLGREELAEPKKASPIPMLNV
jgi:hypothetical protein